MTARDRIYELPHERIGDFEFDEAVADVFPDMIARSVPGYASILSLIRQLAIRYCRSGSQIFDLGCSLGAAGLIAARHAPGDCVVYAVDNSEAMIRRLRQTLADQTGQDAGCRIAPLLMDVREVDVRSASLVLLNFTLQFVPAADRSNLLRRIYDGMLPGGCLLLSEKISFEDPAEQSLMTQLHHDFKRDNGYSQLEISQKRTALENRLIPESLPQHISRLQDAGFEVVVPWFQCFNFVSMLAIKRQASSDTL